MPEFIQNIQNGAVFEVVGKEGGRGRPGEIRLRTVLSTPGSNTYQGMEFWASLKHVARLSRRYTDRS